MSYDAIIINESTDSTARSVSGPLRVYPDGYIDDLNGITISDSSDLLKDKIYIAFKDSSGSGQVCFSKFSPYWTDASTSYQLQKIRRWNAGCQLLEFSRDFSLFPSAGTQYPILGRVDGNGFFYQVGGAGGAGGDTAGSNGWGGVTYETRIRMIELDGTETTDTIDWRDIAPATDWHGNSYDADEDAEFTAFAKKTVSQEDGILVCAFVTIDSVAGSSLDGGWYLWCYVDETMTAGTPWWAPSDGTDALGNPRRIDPFAFDPGGDISESPLPAGYVGQSMFNAFTKLYKVDQTGSVTDSELLPNTVAGFPNQPEITTPASNNTHIYFQSDGSFWIGYRFTNSLSPWLFDSSLNFITATGFPKGGVNFIVSSAPLSSGDFRFISVEFDDPDYFYRVRDKTGAVVVEKPMPGSYGSATNTVSAGTVLSVQQTADNCFLCSRPIADYAESGVYKFAADNLVCQYVGGGDKIWSRGQFAHFDYTDWPVDETS